MYIEARINIRIYISIYPHISAFRFDWVEGCGHFLNIIKDISAMFANCSRSRSPGVFIVNLFVCAHQNTQIECAYRNWNLQPWVSQRRQTYIYILRVCTCASAFGRSFMLRSSLPSLFLMETSRKGNYKYTLLSHYITYIYMYAKLLCGYRRRQTLLCWPEIAA